MYCKPSRIKTNVVQKEHSRDRSGESTIIWINEKEQAWKAEHKGFRYVF